ncbi:futalosine hydrolase [Rhodopirellula baltica]|uniref:Futalosine hydrolase n=1 Tax=Rhodopirellula baltica SWK14 TaxID=993516 RepID=L7C8T4_RHOBT|nr:futalosine hydrolase [Rhodopirellula baltica]ELP29496.1 Futalosine nucleosidase [Rhodopirellula baltica SWK14]
MADVKTTLLLIPTSGERSELLNHLDLGAVSMKGWTCELCGFGLVASAAATMRAIQLQQPARVILAGIAGGLSDAASVGSAHWFDQVICDGIGVGEGEQFASAESLGWQQWPGTDEALVPAVGDRIDLSRPKNLSGENLPAARSEANTLISVCAASSDGVMASRRGSLAGTKGHDGVVAEDMEAFGVAMACQMTSTPCMVVRGISNAAGDRDHSRWQITAALRSVADRLMQLN